MNTDIFNPTFVTRVINALNEECPKDSGKRITRTDLASKLGLQKEFESTLGAMIKYNMIDGWSTFKGVNGGIGRVGEKPAKKHNSSTMNVTEEFIDRVNQTLSKLVVSGGSPVSRRDIAQALGEPGNKTEALISAALKTEPLNQVYTTKRGKGGGVILIADKAHKPVQATNSNEVTVKEDTEVAPNVQDDLEDEITYLLEKELNDSDHISEAM